MSTEPERKREADRVTWLGFFTNLGLTALKMLAGILGNSGAMIADAVHSISDFATDIVILGSFAIVDKPSDQSHDYGHGKFETLATMIISVSLFFVGIGIFYSGAHTIWHTFKGEPLEAPGLVAFFAALASILVKEWLYHYTVASGKKINSQAVIANAWHHRSDAFSSIGTAIGIGGAILLGEKWRILDPIAAVIVSLFIIKVGWDIAKGSVSELLECSLSEKDKQSILSIVSAFSGVSNPHNLRTRRIGNTIAVDIHIRVTPTMTVAQAHSLTTKIEKGIRQAFGEKSFVSIHVEPQLN
jgi:cation diffusion facilitator family transporter